MKLMKTIFLMGLIISTLIGCTPKKENQTQEKTEKSENHTFIQKEILKEAQVQEIKLTGPIATPRAEVSGMTWYKEHLLLLPQYPYRFESEKGGKLFAIPKQELLNYIANIDTAEPITPIEIDFVVPESIRDIKGYEGFEAFGFHGDKVFITIEGKRKKGMMGFITSGQMAPDMSCLTLDDKKPVKIHPQAKIKNFTEETLLVTKDRVITIFEGNGKGINDKPQAHVFDFELNLIETIGVPNIEFRVTDATIPDESGGFWVINYFFPGNREKLNLKKDHYTIKYGTGESHLKYPHVERLIHLNHTGEKIRKVKRPPILMQLAPNPRNWEGLVKLDNKGFLIIADEHPDTVLAFIAFQLL
jgi:hypothetical protein